MIFNRDPPRYCSYLLRCWQEPSLVHLRPAAWRFSLENPHTGQRHGFATFDALMAFLRNILEDECSGAPGIRAGEGVG